MTAPQVDREGPARAPRAGPCRQGPRTGRGPRRADRPGGVAVREAGGLAAERWGSAAECHAAELGAVETARDPLRIEPCSSGECAVSRQRCPSNYTTSGREAPLGYGRSPAMAGLARIMRGCPPRPPPAIDGVVRYWQCALRAVFAVDFSGERKACPAGDGLVSNSLHIASAEPRSHPRTRLAPSPSTDVLRQPSPTLVGRSGRSSRGSH